MRVECVKNENGMQQLSLSLSIPLFVQCHPHPLLFVLPVFDSSILNLGIEKTHKTHTHTQHETPLKRCKRSAGTPY
jgi:hypothetical protein